MNETYQWIVDHATDLLSLYSGIIIAARIIVKLTPTPTDDSILEKIVNFLKHVGLVVK